ncbi:flagellar biosynthesis protein FlhA [Planobispora longispora]|uniref:Flagellar biosynthesis protein FlhA n=1 Tax=Planobispora longispora TaxID=28887 RepID=A0A8J3WB53_9ACTN|nr:flagellar biosynthesis protein FlhA [Planobispora longispora]GIH81481.1 flagellar biosynthesis protein FlhA [Planobispora longispora]
MPKGLSQLAVPIGVVMIVVMMVVPMPTVLLDMLIAANITIALIVVVVSMNVKRPLEFSSFPALLLVLTLFRLALNISATRLVLVDGYAGKVIEAFGHFVVGGSLIVGIVIFTILIIIQFIVITKGAERVAEVGARFTLDAMPGKQMAIDADLNAGLIDEAEARKRRHEVTAEADFYGSMDGGSKFVKGDAIAAIIITVINLLGGFAVGVFQKGMPAGEAIQAYSLMSIGDGLVSQIPALLLSVATGLMVARASGEGDMGTTVTSQLGAQKRALQVGGGAALALVLIPGLPKLPFLVIGGIVLFLAQRVPSAPDQQAEETETAIAGPAPDSPESLMGEIRVDPLELALSPDLVDLVEAAGGDLLDRVRALRRKIAMETGVIMPPVHTRDDLDLPLSTYVIRVNGVEVARGQAPPGTALAIGEGLEGLPGRAGQEPVFGLEGKWIPAELRHQAELLGATVVDRASVIITHLSEAVRSNAGRLLGREDVRALVEAVRRTHPVVVEELTPALMGLGQVQTVLQALLDEGVSIRDLVRIFEALSLAGKNTSDPDALCEAVRNALGPAIAAQHAEPAGSLPVLTLDPRLENALLESLRPTDQGVQILIDPVRAESLITQASRLADNAEQQGVAPVLVCSPQLRMPLRRLLKLAAPRLPLLSYTEIAECPFRVETLGVVTDAEALAA